MRTERIRGQKVDCPHCGFWDSLVIGGRFNEAMQCYERRRKCQNPACLKGFSTEERSAARDTSLFRACKMLHDKTPPEL